MKLKYIFVSMLAALAVSSCSVYNKVTGNHPKSMTVTTNKTGEVSIAGKGGSVSGPVDASVAKGTPNQPTAKELTGGKWFIASVGSTKVEAEDDAPYIEFGRDGRFYGSNGCNILNGTYLLRKDGVMVFSNVLTTMKMCHDAPYEYLINGVIKDDARLTAECQRIGQDTYLSLMDDKGKTLITLRRNNMEFLNGNWAVTSIDGQKIDDPEANIFFDVAELKVHGNTGCNYFNGDLYFDPQRTNAVDISNMGVTRMACYKTSQETAMLVALEETTSAIAGTADDTVLLLNADGKQVLTLKRIPISEDNQ